MQAKLNEQQFKGVVVAAMPTFYLKLNQVCVERCSIDLTTASQDSPGRTLSSQESECLETCYRAYIRMTKHLIEVYHDKLT
jgi:hypothetical protein